METKFKIRLKTMKDAALFVAECDSFTGFDILYGVDRYLVDARSLMGVMSVPLDRDATVLINTQEDVAVKNFKHQIKLWLIEE